MVAYVQLSNFWWCTHNGWSCSSRCGWRFISSVSLYSTRTWRRLKRCTLWLVPALIASVPLLTNTYGLSPGGNARYIYAANKSSVAFIERLALWDGPAMFMLIATSIAMVVMVIALAGRVYRISRYEPISEGDQFWKALKQLLPLAIFPIVFFFFEIPVFIFHVYATQH